MTEEEKQKELKTNENTAATQKLSAAAQPQTADYGATMATLKKAESTLPVFTSSYDSEINELYERIVNRQGFRYDAASDPTYAAYRDRYTREGERAMRDTMGQAASLTGGYSSSYAQSVGQQQYDAYLQKLQDALPELYSAAYKQYEGESERLLDSYNAATSRQQSEYGRFRDTVSDERYILESGKDSEQTAYDRTQDAYANLTALISKTGYQAGADELSAAGMSEAQAAALRYEFLRVNGLLPGTPTAVYNDGGANYLNLAKSLMAGDATKGIAQAKLEANAPGASDTSKSRRK